jgi:cell division protein ZapA (FtsZ GTPase activity inhibitor)
MTELTAADERAQYQITINGHKFSISSSYGEAHIRNVETYLEQQIQAVQQNSASMSPSNLYLLVALNLADQLLRVQKEQATPPAFEQNLRNLCEQLEQVL